MSRGRWAAQARPRGFTLLALYLELKAAGGVLALVVDLDYARHLDSFAPHHAPDGLPLLVAVFAAVAAEALWSCRPWCVRATIAYFCASTLAPLAASTLGGVQMPGEAVSSVIARLVVAALAVMYVHNRAARLVPPTPAPAPALSLRP